MDQPTTEVDFPPREPWSTAAVKLLQGVVYHDAGKAWDEILSNQLRLRDYFGTLGLVLSVDEQDGMAWLEQPSDNERSADYQTLPRLFRNAAMGYEATLLCVLLRAELHKSEEDHANDRCVVRQSDLLSVWQSWSSDNSDDVRLNRRLKELLRQLEGLKFVRQFSKEPPSWEVRRILKARMPLEKLRSIRERLQIEAERRKAESEE